ncbi:MAG: APC family permease [Deltaproteobacteria bacterium]|jgi:amino acid transporter|nr:APC family permease [Deltaproteobacteria bacterium]MBW2530211.1 APC family permease [Deltaproteobacteria bacterium]
MKDQHQSAEGSETDSASNEEEDSVPVVANHTEGELPPASEPSPASLDLQILDAASRGTVAQIDDLGDRPVRVVDLGGKLGHKLGQLKATAICGNDITSSCLYVAALCALAAGPYAPLCLAAVAALLYLFRSIYGEVGTALPLNGGAYNALLNTTSKFRASIAACLTILSYLATAVISATEAMHYAHNLVHINILWATIILLAIFAVLNLIGITESAVVAVGIFAVHMLTLVVLVGASLSAFDVSTLIANWHTPPPSGVLPAIVFGFAAGLLGISGFESSANFIEEQKPGVFPKTLRNMWIAVAIFNPLISVLAMGLIPLSEVEPHKGDFLAHMGVVATGGSSWLQRWVSIDAVLVLSGAVLTAYVGVTGLIRRMALDRCLPQFLLRENRLRRTNHWIILSFFALCCSIVWITRCRRHPVTGGCGTEGGDLAQMSGAELLEHLQAEGVSSDALAGVDPSTLTAAELLDRLPANDVNIGTLAGVYTISFLGVMALFAVGNMLLKVKRSRLRRTIRASWPGVIMALMAVLVGLVANALIDYPVRISVFVVYFAVSVAAVGLTFQRVRILKILLAATQAVVERTLAVNRRVRDVLLHHLSAVRKQGVVFFTRGDNLANLNRAALYVLQNEHAKELFVVHIYDAEENVMVEHLAHQLSTLNEAYPELNVHLVLVQGRFTPETIERLSRRMGIPKNYMFIGTPGDQFPHNIAELGGVRLII